jgi:predicted component of type VI protein secretion system
MLCRQLDKTNQTLSVVALIFQFLGKFTGHYAVNSDSLAALLKLRELKLVKLRVSVRWLSAVAATPCKSGKQGLQALQLGDETSLGSRVWVDFR